MQLLEIVTRNFRNLAAEPVGFAGEANLVLGPNGAGKTSLLEAIVVAGNLRSFRSPSLRPLVRHGERFFAITATVVAGGRRRRLELVFDPGGAVERQLSVDGAGADPGQYLQVFPVFALNGPDREIVAGPPEGRRSLLDRFTFLLAPAHLEALRAYRRALRQRNAAIAAAAGQEQVALWEPTLAAAAARVVSARRDAATRLAANFRTTYAALAGDDALEVDLDYRTESWLDPAGGPEKVEERLRKRYNETRVRDCQTGYTVDGPHRHDLGLQTGGRHVRHVLSTGQAKVVAAALRLATHDEIERERGESLPVVVDDADAELDRNALARLVSHLGDRRQVVLSGVEDRIDGTRRRPARRLWLERGACVRQKAGSDE